MLNLVNTWMGDVFRQTNHLGM